MANRFFVDVEKIDEPSWLGNVEPFLQKVMEILCYEWQEISVLFCDDGFIANMNKEYRQIEGATDVLSFENNAEYIEEGKTWICTGDIVISVETLAKNAVAFNVDEDAELKRLLVHGILHLNGMDHGDEHIEAGKNPECEMLRLQEDVLQKLATEHIIGI